MTKSASEPQAKPTKYYVDFENVHGAGLKGVAGLDERDEVIIIYSQAAETFHIEHAIDIMKSQARIEFVEVDGGTRNAADFQLIVALYANMSDEFDYAIVSGDTGFDAAIKMGDRMGKPSVRRLGNIAGDEAEPEKPKSRRSRRGRGGRDAAKDAKDVNREEAAATQGEAEAQVESAVAQTAPSGEAPSGKPDGASPTPQDSSAESGDAAQTETQPSVQADEVKPSSSRRRSRRRKRAADPTEDADAANAADEAKQEAASSETVNDQPETHALQQDGNTEYKDEQQESNPARGNIAEAVAGAPDDDSSPIAQVKAVLEERNIHLTEAQVETIATALSEPDGRQGFYRRIIKIERQEKGRALYRQVREHYAALREAVGA